MTDPAESTIEAYQHAAIALLPPGRAFPKRPDSSLGELLGAIAVEFARVHEASAAAYDAMFPGKIPEEHLDAWELALGLPGPCVVTPPTSVAERNGAIVAKIQGSASHSRGSFEAAALALGYDELEFEWFAPFAVGSSAVGDPLYGDGWMHAVRIIVPLAEQTADDSLVCALDELRRAHGYLDIILEGPMGATRTYTENYVNGDDLGADITPSATIEIKYQGHLSIQCIIDDGAGGAPSDTPAGAWELWCSVDGTTYTKVDDADAELANIAPNGNNVVSEWAAITDVPGRYAQVRYVRSSGGGGDTSATLHLATW